MLRKIGMATANLWIDDYTHFLFLSSSRSFSMMPPRPKIFYGRESELQDIVKILSQESARIVILGAGGMGKTSLAKAVIHHPSVAAKYEHRFFIACDSAATSVEMASIIGGHIGLKPGRNSTTAVVQYFSEQPSCLLILDNLETPWEPLMSRSRVEEFLFLLTGVEHLGLVVNENLCFFQIHC
jgi:hypothetical protein